MEKCGGLSFYFGGGRNFVFKIKYLIETLATMNKQRINNKAYFQNTTKGRQTVGCSGENNAGVCVFYL